MHYVYTAWTWLRSHPARRLSSEDNACWSLFQSNPRAAVARAEVDTIGHIRPAPLQVGRGASRTASHGKSRLICLSSAVFLVTRWTTENGKGVCVCVPDHLSCRGPSGSRRCECRCVARVYRVRVMRGHSRPPSSKGDLHPAMRLTGNQNASTNSPRTRTNRADSSN